MDRKNIILSLILIIFIVFTFFYFSKNLKKYLMASASFSINIEKTEYQAGDSLRLKIKNNFGKQLCFSTCYPYYLERKVKIWELYPYVECNKDNIHNGCIQDGKEKAFELTLPKKGEIEAGLHRLAVPVCITCSPDRIFYEDLIFHSNEFLIK